jgi:hypothetical protein
MSWTQLDFDETSLVTDLEALIALHGYNRVALEVRRQAPGRVVPTAPARGTDPETSHRAARARHRSDVGRFSKDSQLARLLAVLSTGDFTDQQAAARVVGNAVPSAFESCRRRMSDLRAAGYATDSGRRRKNPGSSDEAIIWTITRPGRLALKALDAKGWSR